MADAQQPSTPSNGSEASLIQLPIRPHPAVRPVSTFMGKAKVKAKAKAKKNVSAARMLRKKAKGKGKVVKTRSQVDPNAVTQTKVALSRRIRCKCSSY